MSIGFENKMLLTKCLHIPIKNEIICKFFVILPGMNRGPTKM